MLGLNGSGESLRTRVRGVLRLGTFCGVVALLVLVSGCPITPAATPCTSDADCKFCEGETCTIADGATDGTCSAGEAPCTADQTCNEEANRCDDCTDDAGCDDGDACTTDTCTAGQCANAAKDCDDNDACTDDSCNADTGDCVNADVSCDAGKTCVDGNCVTTCTDDADCDDDGDPCTVEACTDGACGSTARDCDDNDACTVDSCDASLVAADPDTGCLNTEMTCPDGESCVDGTCVEAACTADTDCDDGAFCNGPETCTIPDGETMGTCTAGTAPCVAGEETCDEAGDKCDTIVSETFWLTLSTDSFTGDAGVNTFEGAREVSGGNFFQTLNNSDSLDGGAGTDTLNAQFQNGGTTTPANLANIEIFNLEVTDGNATTLNLVNATGVTTINNNNSGTDGGDLTVNNVGSVLSNIGWSNGTELFTVNVTGSTLSGTSDACTVNINGIVDADNEAILTIQPSAAGSGYETITVDSQGGVANVLRGLTDGNGTSLKTVNISGPVKITFETELDASVTTVDASTSTGGVVVPVNSTGVNTTCTGGSGDDTFDFSGAAGDYTTSDVIAGGEPTSSDTLLLDDADASVAAAQSNVTGIEIIEVDTALGGNVDVTFFGATKFKASGAIGANTVTIPNGGEVELDVDPAGNMVIAAKTGGTTGSFTFKMDATVTGNLDLTGWGNATLIADNAAVQTTGTLALASAAGTQVLTVQGSQNLTLGNATGDTLTVDELDASTFTGNLIVTGLPAGAITIKGGSGNDTLAGSSGDDLFTGGDGNDTLEGNDGDDSLSGGAGTNTFQFEDTAANNGNDTINDFSTTQILDFTTGGFATDDSPAGTVTDTSTGNQAAADNDIWIVTDADGSINTAAEVAALFGGGGKPFAAGVANMDVVLIIQDTQTGGSSTIWYVDDGDGNTTVAAGECVQVANLANFNGTVADVNIKD